MDRNTVLEDQNLLTIKAFRILNKRCGEIKTEIASATEDEKNELVTKYESNVTKMHALSARAETAGFHLWVGMDGKTGHTYEKDYKITSEETNNWETYQEEIANQESAIDGLIDSLDVPADPSMN
jgi:hypothetical protein